MVVEQHEKLKKLVEVSNRVVEYLSDSLGKLAPGETANRLKLHANNCRQWLISCASEVNAGRWLDVMTVEQREDFERSVLPYCLMVNGNSLVEAYDIVEESLEGAGFFERFSNCSTNELMDLMNSTRVDVAGNSGGLKTKDGTAPLSLLVVPGIMKDNAVLAPEVYGAAVQFRQYQNYKIIMHAAFVDIIDEALANRALDAIAWQHAGSKSHKMMRTELMVYSPKKLPGLRERLTGTPGATPAECSDRLASVIKGIDPGSLGATAEFLLEAINMTPDYRNHVLPLDLAEIIAKKLKFYGVADDPKVADFVKEFGRLLDSFDMTGRELNYVLAKASGSAYANNGAILEMMNGEEHLMLRRFLRHAKPMHLDETEHQSNMMFNMLIARFGYHELVQAIGDDSELAAFVYKATNDQKYLVLVKDGQHLDGCFERDLGL